MGGTFESVINECFHQLITWSQGTPYYVFLINYDIVEPNCKGITKIALENI